MPQSTEVPRRFPVGVFVACLLVAVVVTACGLFVVANPGWSAAEAQVVYAVNAVHSPPMDVVAVTINWAFGPGGILVALAIVIVVFSTTRSVVAGVRTALLIAIPWLIAISMKHVVGRMRPDPSGVTHLLVPDPRSHSFPSGHTAFAAALVCALVLSIAARRLRRAALVAGIVLVVLVAYSRVYLGVHYPTDTLAAMIATPALCIACGLLFARAPIVASAPLIGASPHRTSDADAVVRDAGSGVG